MITDPATLRTLAEAARPETKGRWCYRRSIFPNDPGNYAYVEWGERDAGYGTACLTRTMARYITAASPDRILALLDERDAEEARIAALAEALRTIGEQCRDAFASDGIARAEKVWPLGPKAVLDAWDTSRAALAREEATRG